MIGQGIKDVARRHGIDPEFIPPRFRRWVQRNPSMPVKARLEAVGKYIPAGEHKNTGDRK